MGLVGVLETSSLEDSLFADNAVETLRSAASVIALLTTSRLGFLILEIASFNSASSLAFLPALSSFRSAVLVLRDSEDRDDGRWLISLRSVSLFSRLMLGNLVEVRIISAMALGARDILRRFCCSKESARSNVLGSCFGAARFVAAPGFCV